MRLASAAGPGAERGMGLEDTARSGWEPGAGLPAEAKPALSLALRRRKGETRVGEGRGEAWAFLQGLEASCAAHWDMGHQPFGPRGPLVGDCCAGRWDPAVNRPARTFWKLPAQWEIEVQPAGVGQCNGACWGAEGEGGEEAGRTLPG